MIRGRPPEGKRAFGRQFLAQSMAAAGRTVAQEVGQGTAQAPVTTNIEIEGAAKPACVAESILRYVG